MSKSKSNIIVFPGAELKMPRNSRVLIDNEPHVIGWPTREQYPSQSSVQHKMPEQDEHDAADLVLQAYRADGMPIRPGDAIQITKDNGDTIDGIVVQLGSILSGQRTYCVHFYDGINRVVSAAVINLPPAAKGTARAANTIE